MIFTTFVNKSTRQAGGILLTPSNERDAEFVSKLRKAMIANSLVVICDPSHETSEDGYVYLTGDEAYCYRSGGETLEAFEDSPEAKLDPEPEPVAEVNRPEVNRPVALSGAAEPQGFWASLNLAVWIFMHLAAGILLLLIASYCAAKVVDAMVQWLSR